MKNNYVKPFIKWAGGKQQLMPYLMDLVPKTYGKYIEPFFGGGAFFYALRPENAVINDVNSELVNLYRVARDTPESLINSISKFKNDKESYYRIRSKDIGVLNEIQRASRFLYLNKTCYNGLYRVNRKGEFNVPFAGYKNRKIYDIESIYLCGQLLANAEIFSECYKSILDFHAEPGDLVFLDPPYLPISENSSFNRYNACPFVLDDHIELAAVVKKLDKIGCQIILTNSDHPAVYELFAGMNIQRVNARRSVSCNGRLREGVDLIVSNMELDTPSLRESA